MSRPIASRGRRQRLLRGLFWLGVAAAVVAAAGFGWMLHKDSNYFISEPYVRVSREPANVLVVYYSRSGHTQAMAREIARRYDADIVRLGATAYTLDFAGWRRSANDARNELETPISPAVVDMRPYDLVFLGSPIWLFRPAPPLWAFARRNNFAGASVVLFNTYNSRFIDEYIQQFQSLVEVQGGNYLSHIHVRRGRIFWQKSAAEVLVETRQQLEALGQP